MTFLDNPFFWAFLSAIGWAMGMLTVGSTSVGRYTLYGFIGSMMAQLPRVVLPLPWIDGQPRFVATLPILVAGAVLCALAMAFSRPGLGLKIYTRPTNVEPLVTTGMFGIVRHPILFANILFPLGWSMLFGSWVGVALVPAWAFLVYLMSFLEEDRLIEVYGDEYRAYRKRVPRMIPFLKL